jgi:hypothetical protein
MGTLECSTELTQNGCSGEKTEATEKAEVKYRSEIKRHFIKKILYAFAYAGFFV